MKPEIDIDKDELDNDNPVITISEVNDEKKESPQEKLNRGYKDTNEEIQSSSSDDDSDSDDDDDEIPRDETGWWQCCYDKFFESLG